MNPNRTQNAAIAERNTAVQEKIRALQKESPALSYQDAYAKVQKLPEMQHIFGAMKQPEALSPPQRNPEQVKASAIFQGKVQAAMSARGINFGASWAAMQLEEPELFRTLTGENDPVKRIKEQNGWKD